jgi:O-antigen ligase
MATGIKAMPRPAPRRTVADTALVRDWRAIVLGVVAAFTTFNPQVGLRNGAIICGLILLTKLRTLRLAAPDVLAILLTTWAAATLVWAVDGAVTTIAVQNQFAVLAIFLSARAVITHVRQLVIVTLGYLTGCLYALYLLITQNKTATFVSELSAARYGIDGVNLNYLAYSLSMGMALVVLLWSIRRPGSRMRILLFVSVPVLTFGLVQSGSRGAVIGAASLVAWVVVHRFAPRVGFRVLCTVVVIAGVSTFTGWADGLLRRVDSGGVRATGDLAGRLTIWPYARQVVADNPFFGVGAGGFRAVNPQGIGAHNVPLEVMSGMGFIGLLLLLGVCYTALLSGTRSVLPRRRTLLIGAMLAISAPIVLSGHWELSPAGWFALALFSRIVVLPATTDAILAAQVKRNRGRAQFVHVNS